MTRINKAERTLERFFAVSPDMLCIADYDARLVEVNQAWSDVLGYDLETIRSRPFLEFVHPEDLEETLNVMAKLAGQEKLVRFVNRYHKMDGTYCWLEWNAHPHGDLVYGAARDITERIRDEERLKRNLQMKETLIALLTSEEKTVQGFLDKALEDVLVYTGSSVGYLFLYEEEEDAFTLRSCSREGREQCRLTRKDGQCCLADTGLWGEAIRRRKPVLVNDARKLHRPVAGPPCGPRDIRNFLSVPVLRNGRIVAVAGVSNKEGGYGREDLLNLGILLNTVWLVVERMRGEAAHLEASRSKSNFLANMSHEIRNPLNAILGIASILAEENDSPEHAEYQRVLRNAGGRLMSLINNILDISRIEANKIELHKSVFDPKALAKEVVYLYRNSVRPKPLEIRYRIEGGIPDRLVGYREGLYQVLVNIVGNAVKFTEEGSVEVVLESLGTEPGWQELLLSVKDTGVGIPREELGRIFDQYVQSDRVHSPDNGGAGLGLAISKGILEFMGSRLEVESQVGKGSCFSFQLRLEVPEAEEPSVSLDGEASPGADEDQAAPVGDVEAGGLMRILLAEDSPDNRFLMMHYLRDGGICLHAVEDGRAALEAYREGCYDLVLLDIQMPEMDGYEALEGIRRFEEEEGLEAVPVLALTSYAYKEEVEKIRNAGFTEHLSKPILKKTLLEALNRYRGDAGEWFSEEERQAVLEKVDQDSQILGILVGKFAEAARENQEALGKALESREIGEIGNLAHKLKGQFSIFNDHKTIRLVEEMQKAAEEGRFRRAAGALVCIRHSADRIVRTFGGRGNINDTSTDR